MPFKSVAQQHFLFAKKPEVAKEFASKTPKSAYAKLPGHVKDPTSYTDIPDRPVTLKHSSAPRFMPNPRKAQAPMASYRPPSPSKGGGAPRAGMPGFQPSSRDPASGPR